MADFVNEEGFDTLLAAGIKPMNGLDFALLQAHHVLVNAKKKRLDAVIEELYSAADQTALAGRVTAVEQKTTQNATDIGRVRTLAEGKAAIDDSAKSTTAVYSSSKTEDLITAAKQAVKDDLLQGAGAAYDSLKELGDLIDTNKEAIDAVKALAAGHVKFDGAQCDRCQGRRRKRAGRGQSERDFRRRRIFCRQVQRSPGKRLRRLSESFRLRAQVGLRHRAGHPRC